MTNEQEIIAAQQAKIQALELQVTMYRDKVRTLTEMCEKAINNFNELRSAYNGDADTADYSRFTVRVKNEDLA